MSLTVSLIFVVILAKICGFAQGQESPPTPPGAAESSESARIGVEGNNTDTFADASLVISINPNYDAVEDLICYQCHSNTSTDIQPLCDENIFKLATPEEKYNMTLQCPSYQGDFCFLKVVTNGTIRETTRGCSNAYDKNGQLMKVGCMWKENLKICLCDTKFCNAGFDLRLETIFIFIALLLTYHFSTFS